MIEDEFPVDTFRIVDGGEEDIATHLNGSKIAPWTVAKVKQAMMDHFLLGRQADVDERVADLWDAAYYVILARTIWEGWLVDWKNSLSGKCDGEPAAGVPSQLFDYCWDALYTLVAAGAIRTRYVDRSFDAILERFPPTDFKEPWGEVPSQFSYEDCCTKVKELIPLQLELVRLQRHFETSPESELDFRVIRLGERTYGNFPGTYLELFVGYVPLDDEDSMPWQHADWQQRRKKPEDSGPTSVETESGPPNSPHSQAREADTEGVAAKEPTAKTASGSVLLFGRSECPVVNGIKKEQLTNPQFNVVMALLKAGEKGLSKDAMDSNSGHGESRKILKRLADSDADWESVISFPGKTGRGYRII